MRVLKSALPFFVALSCRTASPTNTGSLPKAEFSSDGVPSNWGNLSVSGKASSNEARLANAAARRLNDAANLHNLIGGWPAPSTPADAVVAVPVKLLEGGHQPFGDGQSNSSIGWTGWPQEIQDVPVLAYVVYGQTNGSDPLAFVVEAHQRMLELVLGGPVGDEASGQIFFEGASPLTFKMRRDVRRNVFRATLTLGEIATQVSPRPDFATTVEPAPNVLIARLGLGGESRFKLKFGHGGRWDQRLWPLTAHFPVSSTEEAKRQMTSEQKAHRHLSDIAAPPYESGAGSPYDNLKQWQSRVGDQVAHFYPGAPGVHNDFQGKQTAVGGVDTFLVEKASEQPKLQVLYTCFDARNPQNEANWAVPSGAGWHVIGHKPADPSQPQTFAESVVHNLESGKGSGVFSGWAAKNPAAISGEAPFEAKDVATFRILRAGESFTTKKNDFHWYAIDAKRKICTTIWKHFCELRSDTDIGCR